MDILLFVIGAVLILIGKNNKTNGVINKKGQKLILIGKIVVFSMGFIFLFIVIHSCTITYAKRIIERNKMEVQ